MTSNSLNRGSENVRVEAVIIAELKLRDVQRHVLLADLVERADDTALEDRPETLNRLGMNGTDNVLMLGVVNRGVREFLANVRIARPLIGAEQADLFGNSFVDESLQCRLLDVVDDAGDDVALAAHSASDNRFAGSGRPRLAVALNPMPVLCLAADERFVNFNDAAQLGFRFDQGRADFVAHRMCSFVRAETHVALNLERADTLFAGEHQMHHLEPLAKRLVRVLKDGARDMREAITRALDRLTLIALPFERHGLDRENLDVAAARAVNPIGPTASDQISRAGLLIREHGFELAFGHLMDWFRTLGHDGSPYRQEPIWQ
jgi:hypothetical protein